MMLRVHAPSTCFRIFVFDNFISIPLCIARFFPNLFATIDGTRRVSDPVNEFLLNLKKENLYGFCFFKADVNLVL